MIPFQMAGWQGIPNSSFLQIAILDHQVNSGCTQPIKSIINVVVSCRITSDAARLFIYSIEKNIFAPLNWYIVVFEHGSLQLGTLVKIKHLKFQFNQSMQFTFIKCDR